MSTESSGQSTGVLFICLGNICRSPMAEAIFSNMVSEAGLSHRIFCDSAGTASYHIGSQPDKRTLEVLNEAGITYRHQARALVHGDFERFDHVIALDHSIMADTLIRAGNHHTKVRMLGMAGETVVVPDPYYDDIHAFREVYALLNIHCAYLLSELQQSFAQHASQ